MSAADLHDKFEIEGPVGLSDDAVEAIARLLVALLEIDLEKDTTAGE